MSTSAAAAIAPLRDQELSPPTANDNARCAHVDRAPSYRSRTREPADPSTTDFVHTLRALVREIVREEIATARPASVGTDGHLSTRAAARHAGVAVGTIRRWIHDGKLRELRAGRHLRVRREDIDTLLRGERRDGPQPSPEDLAKKAFGG